MEMLSLHINNGRLGKQVENLPRSYRAVSVPNCKVDAKYSSIHHEVYKVSYPPAITWVIQALYDSCHNLRFKLKTPEGAYMLLYADEIMECVFVLIDKDDDMEYFQIGDLLGNILFADCDQVEGHILYIISTETRKRQATVKQDVSLQNRKAKRPRKYSGRLASGVRKLSEVIKQRCSSSQRT